MSEPADTPTQKTDTGYEIPLPKKADVLRDFEKIAKGGKSAGSAGGAVEQGQEEG